MRRIIALLLSVLLLLTGFTALAQDTVTGGDDAALRAFIERFVAGPVGGVEVSIEIGTVATLPFNLPLPDGTKVLGSVTRGGEIDAVEDVGTFVEIYVETPASPLEVLDFYNTLLAAPDWQTLQGDYSDPAGFNSYASSYGSYCYQGTTANLNLDAFQPGEMTALTMRVQYPADEFLCMAAEDLPVDDGYALLPALVSPENVTVDAAGALNYFSPVTVSASSPARLYTEMPIGELFNTYNAQFEAAGWQISSMESSETFAVSRWTVIDAEGNPWNGTFILFKSNDGDIVYDALIYVEEQGVG